MERERAAGTLPEPDAAAARVEIERRILTAADRDKEALVFQPTLNRFLAPALCLVIPLFALGLYLQIGHPGLPSAPYLPDSALPEAPAARLAEVIPSARARLRTKPHDPQRPPALPQPPPSHPT